MKAMIRGKEYEIPSLNVGQLERVIPFVTGQQGLASTFAAFKIVTERSKPQIDDEVSPTVDDVIKIARSALQDCGLMEKDADPNAAAPGAS